MFLEELRKTSIACPSQWEGRLADGMSVYISYRSGKLLMGYGVTLQKAMDNTFVIWRSKDPQAGMMGTAAMLRITGLSYG